MDAWVAGAISVERFGSTWHGKEELTQERPLTDEDNVSTALKVAKLDKIKIHKVQAGYLFDDEWVAVPNNYNLVMTGAEWTDKDIVLRNVKWYDPLQNTDYAQALDSLVESDWHVAGVMQVGQLGEIFAVQLQLPEFLVEFNTRNGNAEEAFQQFVTVSEDRRSGAKHFFLTNIRVVCLNTYNLSIGAQRALPNSKNAKHILNFKTRIIRETVAAQEKHAKLLQGLAQQKMAERDMELFVNSLFPIKQTTTAVELRQDAENAGIEITDVVNELADGSQTRLNKSNERAELLQERVKMAYNKFNDEHNWAARTKYAAFNAMTEVMSHDEGYGQNSLYHTFWGDRAKLVSKGLKTLQK